MGLDARGYISIVELVVYVPLAAASAYLLFSPSQSKKTGWFYLLLLSIVRVVGSALHIVTETTADPSIGLFIATGVLEAAGLSPLMLSTIGFLSTVAQNSFDKSVVVATGPRILHLLNIVSLVLTTVGGVKLGSAKTQDQVDSATTFKHVGVILFMVLFVLVALFDAFFWTQKQKILKFRQMLLTGITLSLPFLFIRVLYSLLSGFSPTSKPGDSSAATSGLSEFNSTTGSWVIYLLMSVLTEIIIVSVYLYVGLMFPVNTDYAGGKEGMFDSDIELNREAGKPLL